ncbi:endonuclease/exonuclease/phosphatase (EEP) superfamily protein YafD [Lewinella marina]|uniref:Endonuclease n=1 Tax=Neolewinella marina TaxID=438751 RepID=A0A2G0CAR7_9BACT|nr:endonuclease/exonuclease/phosphatase family protein [Neolewinella marina]NJB87186.1 endonuclease/exonuclease/phosphatase (EEP) superfamily protein YafD [Neolewinella marina]PHK97068.1 endonuclease [Neolewinella marina]
MHTLRNIFYYLVIAVGTLVILASMFSLIHDVSYWYTKVLDFPRTQYLILGLVCLLLFLPLNRKWKAASVAWVVGLLAAIGVQAAFIAPYYLGEEKVPEAAAETARAENTVSVLIANVLIENKSADAFLDIVRSRDPDMLLAMETDQWWIDALSPLEETYPHVVKYPTDNAYGMALYSRLPLVGTEIKFFNHDDVPSIHTRVELPSGQAFFFHGVHPVAPVPSKKYPDNQGEKEVALGKVAEMVAQESLPAIVAGDLNDVSWSNTARLFEQQSDLRNVRLGRGLYNSFDAHSFIMRWPLDHYFVSEEFSLLELERLPEFGSDHFPMYATFVLN